MVEIVTLGSKLAQDVMSPALCLAERASSRALASGMASAIVHFTPEPNPLERGVISLLDLEDCDKRAAHSVEYAVKEVFKLPAVQETIVSWNASAIRYVDALHDAMLEVLCANLQSYLPSSLRMAMNVRAEIVDYLERLKRKTTSMIAEIVKCNRRPSTMCLEDLEQIASGFEEDHLASAAYLPCAKPESQGYAAHKRYIRVMAQVHAYLQIMCARTCDTVVMVAHSELWDAFTAQFDDHIADKMAHLVNTE
ncbi:hypothetical protein FKP32DRAFT_1585588 [Trametes sanguinea]|nr:hypothetical protein FKP32DRAFT_1585588 [Trametes sanguinea]